MQTELHFDKVFDVWPISDVQIVDIGIEKHINLQPVSALHTGGRHAKQTYESKVCVVELLINKLMRREKNTGQKQRTYKIVKNAFELVYQDTKKNPVQVFVDAIQNAGPMEETIRLRFGGILVPKAVDVSSQRRVEHALRFIVQGAQKCAFKSKRSMARCLADELIAASRNAKCHSIGKKEEKERVARAAR